MPGSRAGKAPDSTVGRVSTPSNPYPPQPGQPQQAPAGQPYPPQQAPAGQPYAPQQPQYPAQQPQQPQQQPGQPHPAAAQHPPRPAQQQAAAQAPYPGQQPGPQGSAGRAPAKRGNPAGLVAVILVVANLLATIVSYGVQAVIMRTSSSIPELELSNLTFSIIGGLLALGAVVLGAIGLAARGRPKALAGIGLGAGAFALVNMLTVILIVPLIYGGY